MNIRELTDTTNKNIKKSHEVIAIYLFILFFGCIIVMPLSNILSNYRFESISIISIFIFSTELTKIFLAYILSKDQIFDGYNFTLKLKNV